MEKPDDKFIPDLAALHDLWMTRNKVNGGNYTSFVEKHEFEIGWEFFLDTIATDPEKVRRIAASNALRAAATEMPSPVIENYAVRSWLRRAADYMLNGRTPSGQ
jgi:hypothetical protein